MSHIRKGYKVVRPHGDGSLSSVHTEPILGGYKYIKGETTHREKGDGPMAVFKTLDAALQFLTPFSDLKIFVCEYHQCSCPDRKDELIFWKKQDIMIAGRPREFFIKNEAVKKWRVPIGTDYASQVTLLEEIPWTTDTAASHKRPRNVQKKEKEISTNA